jgi:hypothetical protein
MLMFVTYGVKLVALPEQFELRRDIDVIVAGAT